MPLLDERPATSFAAPRSVFAPAPAERRGVARDRVRLLVADADRGLTHTRFTHLTEHLRPGDVVVVNDSATVAAQLDALSDRHGPVVVHLAIPLPDDTWVVEVRRAPDADRAVLDAEVGDVLEVAAGVARLRLVAPSISVESTSAHSVSLVNSPTGTGNRLWRAEAEGDLAAAARRYGRPISYGYLADRYPLSDYQTVFGHRPGSAEMPSAGRPFTSELVTRLVAGGVMVAPVTLHTGVSSQEAGEAPQAERFEVTATTAAVVNAARAGGGRVIAVGTTVTRALESAVEPERDGSRLVPARGWTSRVVTPADPPRIVDGLITGWHDPEASHLLLVEAVAGAELTQRAYAAAVDARYLWHEFGDSALLLPTPR
ncbi:S-adenosylmethionine:tRNA ribosyltransferase-isomerase [Nocardioides immobilis]|uniref:S-adenosylmethionine:tRNA ribosyltransferase-isomerase n=1 Tax=Nocardioides immobilis TaxID=2049295 RepID=A0A417XYY5_9ACTN|nr:S-adenosylmethionine:tRNA ribosyltransferase-isomerase [Nocardioides immobilis]RHW25565.1 S-adenosylmethionine:tRNA ribosyltransferase-isomerase [Nocardioides immobilis]